MSQGERQSSAKPHRAGASGRVPESLHVGDDTMRHAIPDPRGLFAEDPGETTLVTMAPYALETAYIGRSSALDDLLRAYRQARDHNRLSFVLLVGASGIGKTRTVQELAHQVRREDPMTRVLVGRSGGRAYGPFARLLARRFRISPTLPPQVCQEHILDEVGALLPATRATDTAHLLGYIMGLPFADSAIVGPLLDTPQQLQSRLFMALRRFLEIDASAGTLVLVLEDLDRSNDETINLMHYLAAGLTAAPVVILGTAQEEIFDLYPNFGDGEAPLQRIDLPPLSEAETEILLDELCRPLDEIPPVLVDHVKKLGGVPRPVIELIRWLLESEVIIVPPGSMSWQADVLRLEATQLPHTYEELVTRRLAAAPPDQRRLLEQAAVVGETFWLDTIVALVRNTAGQRNGPDGPPLGDLAQPTPYTRTAIMQALDHLIERDWITPVDESSAPGDPEYRFVDPVLQALVYEGIDDRERCAYHRSVAQWLTLRRAGETPEGQEEVARHWEGAGDVAAAAACYQRAADAARARFANDQAVVLYTRALSCIGTTNPAVRIHLWHSLGSVYDLKGMFGNAIDAFERMLRLSWLLATRTQAAVALNKMGRVLQRKGDFKLALIYQERATALFEDTGDALGAARSLEDTGMVLLPLGRYDEAYDNITAAIEHYDQNGDRRSLARGLANLGAVQKARGHFDEAQRCQRQALDLHRQLGDRAGVAAALNDLATLAWERGDTGQARHGWQEALSEAEAMGALPVAATALIKLGALATAEGSHEEARRRLEEALEIAEDIDGRHLQADAMRHLAVLENAVGNARQARKLAHRSHAVAAKADMREREARALICLADIFSASLYDTGDNSEDLAVAQRYYERGIALLRHLGNESELGRALERFGRHNIERGMREAGAEHLREALRIYTKLGMKRSADVETLLATM